ncbi:MAG: AMP-binding protein, partial [Anaerolineae bacterium]|nr:AMP-binding protein [Thermoflexales bacterium]MDW8407446.1 AMP-binding protein [Anaerolineae bacterium]
MRTFAHVLQRSFQECPDRIAVQVMLPRQPDRPVTYQALVRGSAGYVRALAEAGIAPGEVVVIILQHSEALIYAFWGAVLYGAVPSILPFLTEKLAP